jgi:hypothetical protein
LELERLAIGRFGFAALFKFHNLPPHLPVGLRDMGIDGQLALHGGGQVCPLDLPLQSIQSRRMDCFTSFAIILGN